MSASAVAAPSPDAPPLTIAAPVNARRAILDPTLLYPFVQAAGMVPPTHDPGEGDDDARREPRRRCHPGRHPPVHVRGRCRDGAAERSSTVPPATLEEARNQPGRAAQIEALTRRIEAEGIKYVFFQQVSVTGRVMGKGVVSSFFPQVAEKGYQLVYGATANLFTDRLGDYIGFGPEESELAAIADLDTFAVLPWDPARGARVLRLLRHGDRRADGRRPAPEPQARRVGVRGRARAALPHRHRARDDVAAQAARRRGADGRHEALLLPHPPVRGATSGAARRRRVRPGARPGHELRRPRGRPRPARAELPLRPPGHAQRTTSRPTGRSAPRSGASTTCCRRSCPSRSPACRPTATTTTSRSVDDDGNNVFHDPDGPAQLSGIARNFLGGLLDHFHALMCVGNPTVNSYCRMWDTGFWAPIYKNWGWQNRTTTVRVASAAGASSTAAWTPPATRT